MDEYRKRQQEKWAQQNQPQNANPEARIPNPRQQRRVQRPPQPVVRPPPPRVNQAQMEEESRRRIEQERRRKEELMKRDEEIARQLSLQFQKEEDEARSQNQQLEESDEVLARRLQQQMYNGQSPSSNRVHMLDEDEESESDQPSQHPQQVDRLVGSPDAHPFQEFFQGGMAQGIPMSGRGNFQQQSSQVSSNGTSTITTVRIGPDGQQHITTETRRTNNQPSQQQQPQPQRQPQQHNLFNVIRPNQNMNMNNRNNNNNNNNTPPRQQRRRQFDDFPNFDGMFQQFQSRRQQQQPNNNNNRRNRSPFSQFDEYFGGGSGSPLNMFRSGGRGGMPPMMMGFGFPFPGGMMGGFGGGGGGRDLSYEEMMRLQEQMGHVNRGTNKQTIDSNTMEFVVKDKTKEIPKDCEKCTVCYEEFENGDNVRRLNCMHVFHVKCIDQWLQNYNAICPICREPIKIDQQVRNQKERERNQNNRKENRRN